MKTILSTLLALFSLNSFAGAPVNYEGVYACKIADSDAAGFPFLDKFVIVDVSKGIVKGEKISLSMAPSVSKKKIEIIGTVSYPIYRVGEGPASSIQPEYLSANAEPGTQLELGSYLILPSEVSFRGGHLEVYLGGVRNDNGFSALYTPCEKVPAGTPIVTVDEANTPAQPQPEIPPTKWKCTRPVAGFPGRFGNSPASVVTMAFEDVGVVFTSNKPFYKDMPTVYTFDHNSFRDGMVDYQDPQTGNVVNFTAREKGDQTILQIFAGKQDGSDGIAAQYTCKPTH